MYDQAELDAIDYYNNEAVGFVVFAAGNSNSKRLYYPGCYGEDEFHGAIGVAATTDSGARASFANAGWGSNYGAWVDISAPGVEVLSTTIHDECSLAMDDEDMTECGYDWRWPRADGRPSRCRLFAGRIAAPLRGAT